MKATSGSGDPAVVVRLPAVRSSDAAQAAADGLANKANLGGLTARLLVPGAPKAALASTVEVKGAPDDKLNGSWLVRGVRHKLVKSQGYTTLLLLAKAAS
jgi:phage protein D